MNKLHKIISTNPLFFANKIAINLLNKMAFYSKASTLLSV